MVYHLSDLNVQQNNSQFSIENLPDSALLKVFSFLPLDKVAQLRKVSTKFEFIGRKCLNAGFDHLRSTIFKRLKEIEAHLPPIESQRAAHPYNKHYQNVLELHLIATSLKPHVEYVYFKTEIQCFFFGNFFDEIKKIVGCIDLNTECKVNLKEVFRQQRIVVKHLDEVLMPMLKPMITEKSQQVKLLEPTRHQSKLFVSEQMQLLLQIVSILILIAVLLISNAHPGDVTMVNFHSSDVMMLNFHPSDIILDSQPNDVIQDIKNPSLTLQIRDHFDV